MMKFCAFQILVLILGTTGCDAIDKLTKAEILRSKPMDSDSWPTDSDSGGPATDSSIGSDAGTEADTGDTQTAIAHPQMVLQLNFENGLTTEDTPHVVIPSAHDIDYYASEGCPFVGGDNSMLPTDSDAGTSDSGSTESPADTSADTDSSVGQLPCDLRVYDDNNTVVTVSNSKALKMHTDVFDFSHRLLPRQEIQFQLQDAPVDMSSLDFQVSFDIILSQSTVDLGCGVQFGLLQSDSSLVVYSTNQSITNFTTWTTIHGLVTPQGAGSDALYTYFDAEYTNWLFDAFRIVLLCEDATNGEAVTYYLDNINIAQGGLF